MDNERGEVRSGGIGVLGALGLIFITLKLLGITVVATWSWLWVLAPFWIPVLLGIIIIIIVLIVAAIVN